MNKLRFILLSLMIAPFVCLGLTESAFARIIDEQDKAVLEEIYGTIPIYDTSAIGGNIGLQYYNHYDIEQYFNPFVELEGRWVTDWFGVYAKLETAQMFMGTANNYYMQNGAPASLDVNLTYLYFYFINLDKMIENLTVGNLWLDYSPFSISGIYGLQGISLTGSLPATVDYDMFFSGFESGGMVGGGKLSLRFPFLEEIDLTPAMTGYIMNYNSSNTNLSIVENAFIEKVLTVSLRYESENIYAEILAGYMERDDSFIDTNYNGVIDGDGTGYTNAMSYGAAVGFKIWKTAVDIKFRDVEAGYLPELRYQYLDYQTLRVFTNEMSLELDTLTTNLGIADVRIGGEWIYRDENKFIAGSDVTAHLTGGDIILSFMMNDIYYEQNEFFRNKRWYIGGLFYEKEIGEHTIYAGLKLENYQDILLFSQILNYKIEYKSALKINAEIKHRSPSVQGEGFSIGTLNNFVDNYAKIEAELKF